MSAFFIFENIKVLNQEAIDRHRAEVTSLVEQYSGKYIVVAGKIEAYEGEWKPKELIIIEFPSFERAQEFYDSEDYRELKELRLANSEGNGILVDGVNW
ncbi:DUF1330 domain-containing protein [Chryseobacterium sp. MIQD13]|uniref:DUF1330 domain-containing protein n=1 Tax=Chryseobacterium sp. MIQD13 TaxID=3422310 RepID=UPI003D2D64AF